MNRRVKGYIILGLVTALLGGVIGLGTALFNTSPKTARATSIYEALPGAIGPDAFSPSYATGQLPASYSFEFESGQMPASSESLYVQPRGTYGGPGSNVCDKEGMKAFFERHPDRAAAWARIQGIPFSEINSFIDGLNTAYLAQNVQLTMYGFKNGQEYGYDAIIAAGTAVLVDDEGLPRARCACGNPLVTDQPPEETTTTAPDVTTTTEPDITIEECPEGTTYYRDEDGNPVTAEQTIDDWVVIDTSDTGFNPSPLDDETEQSTEQWEPNYDLCAPECPEYQPEEGEIYDDSWRYENGQWVPLFGDYSPISDTRLLPGWLDDCGPCPPDYSSSSDVAPPSRRYNDEFYYWDNELGQYVDANGNPGELPDEDAALNDSVDINGQGIDPETEQTLEDAFSDYYDPCAPECPPDYYDDDVTPTTPNDSSTDSSNDPLSDDYVPGGSHSDSVESDENGSSTSIGSEDPCEPYCPPDYGDNRTPGSNEDRGDGYYENGEYYDPTDDGYIPGGGYDDFDPCDPECPPDYNSGYNDDSYRDVEDSDPYNEGYYNNYDPCAPRCPLEVYLNNLPTYFTDPSGLSWWYDSDTGMWTPSNGGAPQADPPQWIRDRLDLYISIYDPNSPCQRPPLCPNPAGMQLSQYVIDNEGVLWTWASGKWYSPTGESRELISDFPGCSPCPAEVPGQSITQYYDAMNYRWFRYDTFWYRADDPSIKVQIWEIPGYVEHCGTTACPDGPGPDGAIYIDPNGDAWFYNGDRWQLVTDQGVAVIPDGATLPGCDESERAISEDQPVRGLIACTFNQLVNSYQMRVIVEGQVSSVIDVFDDIPPNQGYDRSGNLFYRNLSARPTGVVEVRIVLSRGRQVTYNHDVADCMQPTPGTEDGAFGIDLSLQCGFNTVSRLWEIRLQAISTGTPTTEISSVREVRDAGDGVEFRRVGQTFIASFPDIQMRSFYVQVTLYNGSFNQLLVSTGQCDDVLLGSWDRINAHAYCEWNSSTSSNEFHIELAGETQQVRRVRDVLDYDILWNRTINPQNHWSRTVPNVGTRVGLDETIVVVVEMFDGNQYFFDLDPLVYSDGRCVTIDPRQNDEGVVFGMRPLFGCTVDSSGRFLVSVGIDAVTNQLGTITPALVRKVWDSTNPQRYYRPTGVQFVAEWNPSPGNGDGTWITVKLLDGRWNQFLLIFDSCEERPILESSTNPLTSEEPEEPLKIETSTSTSTSLPKVVTTPSSSTSTTVPATTTTTTTTTTTLPTQPNMAPIIESLTSGQGEIPLDSECVTDVYITVQIIDDPADVIELSIVGSFGTQANINVVKTNLTRGTYRIKIGTFNYVQRDEQLQITVTAKDDGGLTSVSKTLERLGATSGLGRNCGPGPIIYG
ncbi:MAG: hypothetical protein EBS76_06710 [Actinobacteria bacterium]|nr:hypothetical protein [Actinomycetota bacterium]